MIEGSGSWRPKNIVIRQIRIRNTAIIPLNRLLFSAIFLSGLSRLYITRIDAEYECDVYFPPIGPEWVEEEDQRVPPQLQVSSALILRWA